MGLFKCLNFQSFPLYLSKRKASVHFHEQMPCLKAVFLQPLRLYIHISVFGYSISVVKYRIFVRFCQDSLTVNCAKR